MLITREEAMKYLKVVNHGLVALMDSGKIYKTTMHKKSYFNPANINEFLLEHSDGKITITDTLLSTKEAQKYLNCDWRQFNRLCKKCNFACYRISESANAKTFYKYKDLKRYKDEFERIKRIKESMQRT